MNKYHRKYTKKNNNGIGNKQFYHRKNNYFKKSQYNNNYIQYNKRKKNSYDIYEEEIPYDKEKTLSTNAPSTKDGSFSQGSNSHSRNQSFNEYYNENIEKNKDSSFFLEEDKFKNTNMDNIPKINLSENEIKNAFYRPKSFKENTTIKNEYKKKNENENIVILEINVKISKDKKIYFKLRKYDDMFQVVEQCCKENEISIENVNFFLHIIVKALNSIYGIYNISLNPEEIKILLDLKEKCNYN